MGSKPPFEQVVRQHGPAVLRLCRAVVGHSDAEDVWSETFLSALRGYPELPDDANLEAWLVRIAQRRAVDVLRSRSRRAVPVAEVPEPPGDNGVAVDGRLLGESWELVAELPDKQRQVIAYRYLAGLPYAEVAGLVGGTAAAARRAAADGIATLRHRMRDGAEEAR